MNKVVKILVVMLGTTAVLVLGFFAGNKLGKGSGSETKPQIIKVNAAATSKLTCDLGEFTVNLADEDTKKYLKVKVFIGYDDKALDKELADAKKLPILKDAVKTILRSKKSTELSKDKTIKGEDELKNEILKKINPMLEKGQANNIYFTDLIIQ